MPIGDENMVLYWYTLIALIPPLATPLVSAIC